MIKGVATGEELGDFWQPRTTNGRSSTVYDELSLCLSIAICFKSLISIAAFMLFFENYFFVSFL